MRKIVFTGLVLGAAMILPAGMAGAQDTPAAGAGDYPPCSRSVTDKCIQTHEGMGGMAGDHAMHHGHWAKHHRHWSKHRHHWSKHHGHGAKHHRHHAKHHDDAKK